MAAPTNPPSTLPAFIPTGDMSFGPNDTTIVPPLPPVLPSAQPTVNPSDEQGTQQNQSTTEGLPDSDGSSGSEESESDGDDEQQKEEDQWRPLDEDRTEPCEDELTYIQSKEERSALDHVYWEGQTFFDLDDPDILPGESGRIDWHVEGFNGTQTKPNKEIIMRSPIVSVGGYDWCIKFYPKGNNTDYLSVYLECVTMQSPAFEETEDFVTPALPYLGQREKLKRRRSAAVQLAVIMYNPAEPRVYEYHMDAHQFTKQSADYGWTRFTRYSRRDFVFRNHGQRQAILRDDKLSFSAYIRVVDDPTKCLWTHGTDQYEDSVALTGLRPFSFAYPVFAAELPLLHFGPFREFLATCKDTRIVFWLHTLLWKMTTRKRSKYYGVPVGCEQSDTIAWLKFMSAWLGTESNNPDMVNELIGTLDPASGGVVGANKLKTSIYGSVQAAVNAHPTKINKPALLTLELERAEVDKKKRKWRKLTNKVEMQDKIMVHETEYTLFAFVTHCGDLESNKFDSYVRPHGPGQLWYKYTAGSVTCLTRKSAVENHSGYDEPLTPIRSKSNMSFSRGESSTNGQRYYNDRNEVAHTVTYVRADCAHTLTAQQDAWFWDVPTNVIKGIPPPFDIINGEPPMTAVYGTFAEAGESTQPGVHPPPLLEDDAGQGSFDEDAGYATPGSLLMDGEGDIAMRDIVRGDDEYIATIDYLGREYYKGGLDASRAKYHGTGHLITMNGDEYVGAFVDHLKSGYGKMIYSSSGDIYEGEWLEGQQHGLGKLTEKSSGNIYEGGWKEGKKHGEFILKGVVTEDDKGCCSICYDREINTAFYDCGHVVACKECANQVDSCPVCRKRILARLELFGVKMTFE